MLDFPQARSIAERTIDAFGESGGLALVLLDTHALESDFGWVFSYQSARFPETRRTADRLTGNAPFIVARANGDVIQTGTALPTETYLARYGVDWRPIAN